ncbi:MAG TPA: CBS domain-containing protein [Thermohalobaculum sp.]|nr:CBS domain-containing protein [Thermohalobaculum sp.]
MKVAEILKQKGGDVVTVRPTETIATFSHRLRMARIGAMVVVGEGGRMEGVISERDVVHGLAEHGARCLELTVADLMTRRVVTCAPGDNIARIARVMTESRIRHIPVLDGGKLAGMVSVGDVVKNRMDEMSLEASVLRDIATAGH